jgi:hypothetical protein
MFLVYHLFFYVVGGVGGFGGVGCGLAGGVGLLF